MDQIRHVELAPVSPERLRDVLSDSSWERLEHAIVHSQELFGGRTVWNVNSTAAGGGVAEMLRSLLGYARGAGVDARWVVIGGDPEFFRVTKRIHNLMHGHPGDGGDLGDAERAAYTRTTRRNADALTPQIRPEDVVILHDPQTAGLIPLLKRTGATVLWRSHIGAEHPNELVARGWDFLIPYVQHAAAYVFSRFAYVPAAIGRERAEVIAPSIDPLSVKNQRLDVETARSVLSHVGLIAPSGPPASPPRIQRPDGSTRALDEVRATLLSGPPPDAEVPLVLQVSRWDRLKDPLGVITGFVRHVPASTGAHLMLAGPSADSVADDPEGAEVLEELQAGWCTLPPSTRARVHLACLPMNDIDQNAMIVNALQRHATLIVQKSLQEGFGLTVSEGMWKARAVIASRVGGIREQIQDGRSGVLLADPADLESFGRAVCKLLATPEWRRSLGEQARERVLDRFLHDRHLQQYVSLLERLLA